MSSHRPRSTKGVNASPAAKRSWILISALLVGFCALIAALDSVRSSFYIFDNKQIYKIASVLLLSIPVTLPPS